MVRAGPDLGHILSSELQLIPMSFVVACAKYTGAVTAERWVVGFCFGLIPQGTGAVQADANNACLWSSV